MDEKTIDEHLVAIRSGLDDWFEEQPLISGSELNALISRRAYELNIRQLMERPVGAGALKAFADAHLSDRLEQCGNRGGDVVYRKAGSDTVVASSVSAQSIWNSFVSPSTRNHLVYGRDQGVLIAKSTSPVAAQNEVGINTVTLEEHAKIREEFSLLPENLEVPLMLQASQHSSNFQKWVETIRNGSVDLYRRWGLFRRERILELFELRLRDLGFNPVDISNLSGQLAASQRLHFSERKDIPGRQSVAISSRNVSMGEPDELTRNARRIASLAIARMSLDDLRSMRLPLGVLIDIIE